SREENFIGGLMKALHGLNIQSVLIEGGTKTLQSFIDEHCWDEARVITNTGLEIDNGIAAPLLYNAKKMASEHILTDTINYYKPKLS
ncbi:MAG: riboflavin biosynthesis protein RibD, partial [Ferruginibacter sp.]